MGIVIIAIPFICILKMDVTPDVAVFIPNLTTAHSGSLDNESSLCFVRAKRRQSSLRHFVISLTPSRPAITSVTECDHRIPTDVEAYNSCFLFCGESVLDKIWHLIQATLLSP
jgi:hypothetical protein